MFEIYKLTDIAKKEWISTKTAQRRAKEWKLLQVIVKDKKEKKRYFDSWKTKLIKTKKEVFDIIANVFEYYWIENADDYKMWFEKWLNNRWLNWNWWENEEKLEQYYEDTIESFL